MRNSTTNSTSSSPTISPATIHSAVIRRYSSLPADDLARLLRWVGFNYFIGNEDAHAKNLAFLYRPDGLRLTPHYDLASTAVYPELERNVATKLGRAWDIRNVQRSDWQRVASVTGVPWAHTRGILLELADQIQQVAAETTPTSQEAFGQSPVYDQIKEVVARQTPVLEQALRRP